MKWKLLLDALTERIRREQDEQPAGDSGFGVSCLVCGAYLAFMSEQHMSDLLVGLYFPLLIPASPLQFRRDLERNRIPRSCFEPFRSYV